MSVTVAHVERAIAEAFPPERAEGWDRGGLLVGDPAAEVTGVYVALDPTLEAIDAAADAGCNVLVTHHPVYLSAPERIVPGRGPAGCVHRALTRGVALVNAHTNLDRSPEGQMLLPRALGLEPLSAIERSLLPTRLITVWVPESAASAVTAAMQAAGAGRIGEYRGCSFTGNGIGAFTPGESSAPCIGTPGEPTLTPEVRVEMVCAPQSAGAVVAAATAAHPYEEPLVSVAEVQIARGAARMGMLCEAPRDMTLSSLAGLASATFSVTARVWGDPDAHVSRVATATGSSGSLVGEVLAAGAEALVCGEVRYHDALDAVAQGLSIVEIGHDMSEWPLTSLLADAVRGVEGLAADRIMTAPTRAAWWTV